MISHKHKVIFIHMMKNAGTSIEKALQNKDQWYVDKSKKHLCYREAAKIYGDLYSKYTTFSIVRNPWSRAVSVYKHLIQRSTINCTFTEFVTGEYELETTEAPWWNTFLKVDGKPIYDVPQTYFICDNNEVQVDHLLRFESLNNDFKKLCSVLGLRNVKLPHVHKAYKCDKPNYVDYYTSETEQIIRERFKSDIEQFNYCFG